MLDYPIKTRPKVTYTIITDVTEEVISIAEAKSYMGIDFPDFDVIIPMFIKAARQEAEKHTGLSIGVRQIKLAGDFTDPEAYMPFAPFGGYTTDGIQNVGYTAATLPGDLKLALLTMIHTAFENRTTGLNFNLKLLDKSRRRVGL